MKDYVRQPCLEPSTLVCPQDASGHLLAVITGVYFVGSAPMQGNELTTVRRAE